MNYSGMTKDRLGYIYDFVVKNMTKKMENDWGSEINISKESWLKKVHSRVWYNNFKEYSEENKWCDVNILMSLWKFLEKHRRFSYQHHSTSALESVLVLIAEKQTEGVPDGQIMRMRLFEII